MLKRFLDIDHLISLIVTVPKRDTQRTAEATITNVSNRKIADGVASIVQVTSELQCQCITVTGASVVQVIHLKHVLQLVEPLQSAIKGTNNKLLNAFCQVRLAASMVSWCTVAIVSTVCKTVIHIYWLLSRFLMILDLRVSQVQLRP